MGREVSFDYSKAAGFVNQEELDNLKDTVLFAKDILVNRTGAGNDFLGWIDLPVDYDKEEFARIKEAAKRIQNDSGCNFWWWWYRRFLPRCESTIDFLSHSFYNNLPKDRRKTPEIYFVGNSISSKYIKDLQDMLEGKDFPSILSVNPALRRSRPLHSAYSKKMLIEKYGKEEANKRIYATTDKARGALKNLANEGGI